MYSINDLISGKKKMKKTVNTNVNTVNNLVNKPKQKQKKIPKHIKTAWKTINDNFVRRHKNLKQGPLKTLYQLIDDFMEGK